MKAASPPVTANANLPGSQPGAMNAVTSTSNETALVVTETQDIQAIQAECTTMIALLQRLEKEEHDLRCQLEILAKEALLCGFQNDVIEPPIPKKRNKRQQPQPPAAAKEDTAKSS